MAFASSCCVIGRPRPRREPSTERRERSLLPRVIEEPTYCNMRIRYYLSLFHVKNYIFPVFNDLWEFRLKGAPRDVGTQHVAPLPAIVHNRANCLLRMQRDCTSWNGQSGLRSDCRSIPSCWHFL